MTTPGLPARWPAPANVRAFTTLRHGAGISPPPLDTFNLGGREDTPANLAHNRAELLRRFTLPSAPCWLHQVHGTCVQRFNSAPDASSPPPTADAAVTAVPGVVLAILTADCLPVVFAAHDGTEIAAAHAGWRGLAAGVLECTLAAMSTPPDAVMAWLGPAAGPAAYEVGQNVVEAFAVDDAHAHCAFSPTRPGHWRIDLYALARLRLTAAGMDHRQIFGGGLCTISDPQRFYSYRRDHRTGRMATLVLMRCPSLALK